MRTAGVVAIVLGLLLGIGLAIFPTSFTELGTSIDCGAPILRSMNDDRHPSAEEAECEHRSRERLVIGVVLGLVLVVSGWGMTAIAANNAVAAGAAPAERYKRGWASKIAIVLLLGVVAVIAVIVAGAK